MAGFYQNHGKSIFDLCLSMAILLLVSWLFLLVIVCYVIVFEFPVFFSQQRMGRGGKAFTIWKFRTLKIDESLPMANRTFILGSFLRVTSLDELPQIWNILKGEMSWIGPRALPIEYKELFSAEQNLRFEVKPGITGWAQVNGRHSISWAEKFALDAFYVKNLSFSFDFLILIRTIVLLLSIRKDISLEEEPFKGNV